MSYVLAERDGVLCAKQTMIDDDVPRIIVNYYHLTQSKEELAFFVPDINRKLGCVLVPLLNPATVWQDDQGWKYYITSGVSGERIPLCTEVTPIPEPLQRGRKYPLQWLKGQWYKKTGKGFVRFEV